MKPPVALFKKKVSKIVFVFKSQMSKPYIINTVVCCLHEEKDVKKAVKRKLGKEFFNQIICYLSFKNNTSHS